MCITFYTIFVGVFKIIGFALFKKKFKTYPVYPHTLFEFIALEIPVPI